MPLTLLDAPYKGAYKNRLPQQRQLSPMTHNSNAAPIESLLQAMTAEEKIGQLTMAQPEAGGDVAGVSAGTAAAIREGRAGSLLNIAGAARLHALQSLAVSETRLGIPLLFALDVLHGYETIFPIPLGEAAAVRSELCGSGRPARRPCEAAADGIALTFAPMLDVARDPRWGRIAESPGEDPWLASRFAGAKVRGFQGDAPPASARPPSISRPTARSRPGANMPPSTFRSARCTRSTCRPSPRPSRRARRRSCRRSPISPACR